MKTIDIEKLIKEHGFFAENEYGMTVCVVSVKDIRDAPSVDVVPAVPGHTDQYNIAEMSYNNGYAKGYEDGKNSGKRGHWIIKTSGHGTHANNWAECSECHVCGSPQWKVCPVCESRMEPIPLNDIPPEGTKTINIGEVDFDYAAEDDHA